MLRHCIKKVLKGIILSFYCLSYISETNFKLRNKSITEISISTVIKADQCRRK